MKNYTSASQEEQKEARRKDAQQTIDNATKALLEQVQSGKSELLLHFLDFCARFHHYSYSNQQIIKAHGRRRDLSAVFVASYQRWQEIGKERYGQPFQVAKGERAIWIWAPAFHKAAEGKMVRRYGKEVPDEDYTYFILVPVFADYQIDQSEGQPSLDPFFHDLQPHTDTAEVYVALIEVARTAFKVYEEDRPDLVRGYYNPTNDAIAIKKSLDSTSKVLVLAHEYTHALLHKNTTLGQKERECEAEAVAYIVGCHFGIESPFSAGYLQMYGNDGKSLKAQLERIQKTAHSIIDNVEAAMHKELAEAA